MSGKLANKSVFITGGAGGLGRAMAEAFFKKGALVTLLDRDKNSLASAAKELNVKGWRVKTAMLDVTRKDDYTRVFKKQKMPVDIWINNAGIAQPGNLDSRTMDEQEKLIAINLLGVMWGTRFAIKLMENAGGGIIVNMASVAGHVPSPFLATYAASKHGVVGFTRSLAEECRWRGLPIRFCLVSPGFADTGIIRASAKITVPGYLVSKPQSVAEQIVRAIENGDAEVYPGISGRSSVVAYRLSPRIFSSLSRFFASANWRELIGWESIER